MIVLLYQGDFPNNTTPNGHTNSTVLIFLYLRQWRKGTQIVGGVLVLIILISILFTRKHYILDLVAGPILAIGA
jgi:membrane-associated phospholipid phosphatase